MTARMVMLAARIGLLFAVLGLCALATSPAATVETLIGAIGATKHFGVFYALTTLSITAFPKGRRNDICVTLVVFAAMIEVLRERMGAPRDLAHVLVDALGVLAVHVPTHLEVLRQNMRHYPAGSPFALQFTDRRRLARKASNSPAAVRGTIASS